jgi:hypothetical protein
MAWRIRQGLRLFAVGLGVAFCLHSSSVGGVLAQPLTTAPLTTLRAWLGRMEVENALLLGFGLVLWWGASLIREWRARS